MTLEDEILAAWRAFINENTVYEYANIGAFPITGEAEIIYLALDTNKLYRWSGAVYIQIGGSSGLTFGEATAITQLRL